VITNNQTIKFCTPANHENVAHMIKARSANETHSVWEDVQMDQVDKLHAKPECLRSLADTAVLIQQMTNDPQRHIVKMYAFTTVCYLVKS